MTSVSVDTEASAVTVSPAEAVSVVVGTEPNSIAISTQDIAALTFESATTSVDVSTAAISVTLTAPDSTSVALEAITTEVGIVTSAVVVNVELPGVQGAKGEPGVAAEAFELPAGEDIGGHRAVSAIGGELFYTDPTNPSSIDAMVGVSLNAASAGGYVQIADSGQVTEPSWAWSDGPVWVGANGVLTQVLPAANAVQIGVATGLHSLIVTHLYSIFGS